MPFKEGSRRFWQETQDDRCQYEEYTEKRGFRECGKPTDGTRKPGHVHHIEGEAETLSRGEDPERNVGLNLCQNHHVRNSGEDLGDPEGSFHPDMSSAYRAYPEWKQNAKHMAEINGRRSIDYSDSPFAETARGHQEMTDRGERYINGDWQTDEYYTQKARDKATRYLAEHPGERKPDTSPHPKTDHTKRKHWYDGFFGGGDEDE